MTTVIQTKPEPYCPKCGAVMKLRRPNRGQSWDAFWGCNRYPDCKGTRQIDLRTGKIKDDDLYPLDERFVKIK